MFINKNILVLLFASVKRFGVSVCKIFYPNFEPLYHLNHIKIFIEAFSQNCIYVKYLSFTTFVILVTILGVEQFVSAYFFSFLLSNFSCQSSEHEQEPKLVFYRSDKSNWRVLSLLRDLACIHMKTKQTLTLCLPQVARVCLHFL